MRINAELKQTIVSLQQQIVELQSLEDNNGTNLGEESTKILMFLARAKHFRIQQIAHGTTIDPGRVEY